MAISEESFQTLSTRCGFFRHSTNIGVLQTDADVYLIDSGSSDADGEALYAFLQRVCPQKRLAAVINTHSHSDHVGGNAVLVQRTGCEIWAPPQESIFIEHPELVSTLYWGARPFSDLHTATFETAAPCAVSRFLRTEEIELNGLSIRCVPLPGHFHDQMGILIHDHADGKTTFFLGDAFFGVAVIKRYWIPFILDPQAFRASVERIAQTAADTYIPSHGEPSTPQTVAAMAELNIMITYETEKLILRLLRTRAMGSEELLKAVADYAGIDMKMSQIILIGTTLRSYLSSLYNAGKVGYLVSDNRLLWKALE